MNDINSLLVSVKRDNEERSCYTVLTEYFCENEKDDDDENNNNNVSCLCFFNEDNSFKMCDVISVNYLEKYKNKFLNENKQTYLILYTDLCFSKIKNTNTFTYLEYILPNQTDNTIYAVSVILNNKDVQRFCKMISLNNKFACTVKSLLHVSFIVKHEDGVEALLENILQKLTSTFPFLIRKIDASIFLKL